MSDWKPTPDCNYRCYGEPCVHRAEPSRVDDMKTDLEVLLKDHQATAEERMELGIWLTGKGIGQAWTEAVEGHAPD